MSRRASALDRLKSDPGPRLRRMARWLELRSFGLTPDQFSRAEGLRAIVAVALPLLLVLMTGRHVFGWAVFAAFWTCLCDIPAAHRLRCRLLAVFVVGGTMIAFLGSWGATLLPGAALIVGPQLVFATALLPALLAHAGMLSVLLGAVAVVSVGFPLPMHEAGLLALSFLIGSSWAFLLIGVLWRIDDARPLEAAAAAALDHLFDMIAGLAAMGEAPHRDAVWHAEHGEHRRTVRAALERLRGLLSRYRDKPAAALKATVALRDATELLFSAAIALEHEFITREETLADRRTAAQALLRAVAALRQVCPKRGQALRIEAESLAELAAAMPPGTARGCVHGAAEALFRFGRETGPAPMGTLSPVPDSAPAAWPGALRQALRQAVGVLAVYAAAFFFGLGYPYWAAMAAVVVLQSATRITFTRAVERVCGSLLGGALALGLLSIGPTHPVLAVAATILAGLTIALRGVNYTVFVLFLTMLFIVVTEILEPGAGIASARMLDNTVGSIAALLAALLLWPDFGPPLNRMIAAGLEANRAYLDAVEADADEAAIHEARRRAGLASIAAEVGLHDLGGFRRRWQRLPRHEAASLKELRMLAGRAAAAWHRRLAERALSRP